MGNSPDDGCAVGDIMAYLLDHRETINEVFKGEITFGLMHGRLIFAKVLNDQREGYQFHNPEPNG
jgi:hypothetical protein